MGKLTLVVMFMLLVAIMPMVHGTVEEQKETEKWFQKVSYAKEKMTKLHFYWHDTLSGKNPTSMQVAQSAITATSPTAFGRTQMIDNPLTVGPEPTSKLIGRCEGLYALSSLEELSVIMAMNMVFTDAKYKNSSLTILGRNSAQYRIREMPIVGGSGVFRFARGFATAQTYSFNLTTLDAVVEYNLYVIHH